MAGDGGSIVVATTARLGLVDQDRALRALNMSRRHQSEEIDEYVQAHVSRDSNISRILEQGMADSCVARLVGDKGAKEEADFFSRRAQSIRKYWSPKLHVYAAGDQISTLDINVQSDGYQEGTPLEYSWAAPYDIEWQVQARGGRKKFVCELNEFFTAAPEPVGQPDVSGNIHGASLGNEPSVHTPYLFSLVGDPARTQDVVDEAVKKLFSDSLAGLPGNDDMGQMSSWLVFSLLGLYPVDPCSGLFTLGRPFVEHARLALKSGILEMVVHEQSEENKYVEYTVWKGDFLKKTHFSYEELAGGGLLEMWMSSTAAVSSPAC